MADPALTLLTSPAELGAAVRRARTHMGLSLREAAKRARVGTRFLFDLEGGKPTVQLQKALQVMFAMELLAIIVPYQTAMAALGPQR